MNSPALLKLIKPILVLVAILVVRAAAYSQSQYVNSTIRGQDSQFTYLGVCSSNAYKFDSILNVIGQYGSSISSYSIRNTFSNFGSSFSSYSAYNSYAAYPPIIYNSAGIAQAYLTKNVLLSPRIDPDVLINYLSSLGGSGGVGTIAILMESGISFSTTGRTTGSTATLNVERINNYRANGTVSGTLALQLWATASEYLSGTLSGYKLVEVPIGTSLGGYYYNKISVSGTLTAPPNGNYNLVMVLAEWNGSAYVTVDWGNFSNRTSFGITEIAPVILTQPSSATITSGGNVSFNASASGTPAPTYQWKKDGSLLAGATSSTYSISSVTTSDAGIYTVVATNSVGSVTSNSATLTVTPPVTAPTVTTQPSAASVTAGNSVSFSVAVSGTSPFTYQWKKDGTSISGATSSTYSISSTSTSAAGSYTVVVTNSAGSATSNAATLTVAAALVAPTITTQPSSSSVTTGNAASFSVVASGTATLTYQWKKDGTSISAATSSTYSISSTSTSDAGSYTVVVTNSAGSATSNAATLTVAAAVVAPTITTQPSVSSVTAGSAASFTIVASGTAPLTYQWKKDGTSISGATSSTYSISSTSTSDAGSYTVIVTNSAGSATSNSATLTVAAAVVAPTITTQPSASSVTAGSAASFSVVASGTAPLTYQWKKDGTSISAATSSTYSISSTSTSDAGSYTVVVTNSAGSATSNAATLTVAAAVVAPTITTQPNAVSVQAGGAASFSVSVSGTAPFTYLWKKDGAAIAGATSSTFTINSTASSDAGSYSVVVTNSVGSASSSAVTLTLVITITAPTITTQPSAASVTAGNAASFSVVASGTSPFTYQWKKDGTSISGATSSTYSISSTSTSDAGSYTVVVTNSAGSATSDAATLTVAAAVVAPTITTQPSSSSVTAGSAASFTVVASGTAPLTYQWKKDGTSISAATSSSYSISSTSSSDAGSYTVVVTNSAGSATSNAATLTVAAAVISPTITTQPNAASVQSGGSAGFSVVASGTAPLSYQWRKDGTPISGATNSTYTVSSATVINAGNYTVVVNNGAGSVTSNSATLTVVSTSNTLSIVTQPTSASILLGQNATFSALADGAAPLKYEWKKDGASIAGATGSTLRLVNVTAAQAGSYSVLVTSSSGSVTSNSATLTVNSPLTISGNPTSRSAAIGDALASAFSVTATAASGVTLTYQWRKDGVNITGATSATLGLTSITASDFGTYSVTVSSPTGTITSSPAALYRASDPVVAPVIRREPKGITIKAGSSLILSVAATGSPAPTYQWQLNGTAVPGATASTLVLTDILASQAGSYNVVATNSAGSATSKSATVVISDGFGRQLNLSTLGYVGTGGDILIPGFVVAGNGVKRLLIRAAGPALAQFGVSDVLADPQLALFKGSVEWLSNDNWSSDAANAASVVAAGNSVGAFALTAGSKDSALVASLDPGAYSIQVSGVGGTTGKAIVEAYDLDAADPDKSRLVNLATRALVQAGAGPLISGFVVQGAVAKAVLIRATGPALAGFGVTGTLALPRLTVFDSTSTPIAENAGWDSSGISDQIIAASQSVGAFALTRGTADSVVLAVLPPGSYTAQVIGADGGSGVTLVEVYELP
jgi:hypothetical protein